MKTNNNFRILIVDDEPLNIELASAYLQEDGYKLSFATNGLSTIESVASKKIDLILLDINMPGIDGFKVCELLKENPKTKDIPVIFLTAQTDIKYISRAFEVGGVDYISKPFNGIELKVRVHTHLQNVAYLEDIKTKQSKLAQLSITDPLTKLYNALYFDSLIKKYQHNKQNFWIIYIKINNFDKINKIYGYYGANKIIRIFSKLLTDALPPHVVVAKLHGVSFGIVLKEFDKSYIQELGKDIYSSFTKSAELNKMMNYSILYFNVGHELPLSSVYKKLESNIELAQTDGSKYNLFIQ